MIRIISDAPTAQATRAELVGRAHDRLQLNRQTAIILQAACIATGETFDIGRQADNRRHGRQQDALIRIAGGDDGHGLRRRVRERLGIARGAGKLIRYGDRLDADSRKRVARMRGENFLQGCIRSGEPHFVSPLRHRIVDR